METIVFEGQHTSASLDMEIISIRIDIPTPS